MRYQGSNEKALKKAWVGTIDRMRNANAQSDFSNALTALADQHRLHDGEKYHGESDQDDSQWIELFAIIERGADGNDDAWNGQKHAYQPIHQDCHEPSAA